MSNEKAYDPCDHGELKKFIIDLGFEAVPHAGGLPYLEHLNQVYYGLKAWGRCHEACLGGFLHSIYGTVRFAERVLPVNENNRNRIKGLVGGEAELLAYANCFASRLDMDSFLTHGPQRNYSIRHRLGGSPIGMTHDTFMDLCAIQLCDWLVQVPLDGEWDHDPDYFGRLAEVLGGWPRGAFHWVYRGRVGL